MFKFFKDKLKKEKRKQIISYEYTIAFEALPLVIKQQYPKLDDEQIDACIKATLAKTKSPRSKEKFLSILKEELITVTKNL